MHCIIRHMIRIYCPCCVHYFINPKSHIMKSVPVTQYATCGKYFYLLFVCTACLLIFPDVVHAQQKPKYNVLFIAVDDMNSRVNFLGYPEVITPNLQRLVNRGMVFKQAYCQYPICNASRTSLLTGWRPDKTQIFSNEVRPRSLLSPEVKFLPEFFKETG